MISQTVEYALRAVVCLAKEPTASMTTERVAEIAQIPASYLSKVLQLLRRGGLVRSQRGVGGGFQLARLPSEITILEVVSAVDPIRRIERCPLELPAHGVTLCPLHRRLDRALELVEKAFRETTVAELLADAGGVIPLCSAFSFREEPRR